MSALYIGLENEIVTFKKQASGAYKDIHFAKAFESLKSSIAPRYSLFSDAILSTQGICYYVDKTELEVVTPPVRIDAGAATRLVDLLLTGRDVVLSWNEHEGNPYTFTGYSMHWNVTDTGLSKDAFFKPFAPVFAAFASTPLSVGVTMREKEGRHELVADSINNEAQLRSLALLLGAYRVARCLPPALYAAPFSDVEFAKHARVSRDRVVPCVHDGTWRELPLQEYLEKFVEALTPTLALFGTAQEREELADFISGRRELEIDKTFSYDALRCLGGKSNSGSYWPIAEQPAEPQVILSRSGERTLPSEGSLWGKLVSHSPDDAPRSKTRALQIGELDWNSLTGRVRAPSGRWKDFELKSVDAVYAFAEDLASPPQFPPRAAPPQKKVTA